MISPRREIDGKRRPWSTSWSTLPLKWKERVLEVTRVLTQADLEHGVGMVKKDYLVAELGLETVEAMRRIKVPSHLLQ